MKYKCIKELYMDTVDGDGFLIEAEGAKLEKDTIWEVDNDGVNVTGSDIKLVTRTKDGFNWIEIDGETLKNNFKIIEN